MTNVDHNRFNTIVVLDSVPKGELQTAKRLVDLLTTLRASFPSTPRIEEIRVEGSADFLGVLGQLRDRAAAADVIPLLHIECHGDTDGFQLADGSVVTWPELKQPLIDLNIATALNLMIVVAACVGGAMLKVVGTLDRAPLWGLIGPTRDMTAGELEAAYAAFYDPLMRTGNARAAVDALDKVLGPQAFLRATAQGLFLEAWQRYKDLHGTGDGLRRRARELQQRIRHERNSEPPGEEEVIDHLRDLQPKLFAKYVESYFMCDIFPDHRSRFAIAYPEY